MAKSTLYAYLLGADFGGFSERFVERAEDFVRGRTWIRSDVWIVNQRRASSDGVVGWKLGLNLDLPDPFSEEPDWFTDVEKMIIFCIAYRAEFHHGFEIGISDNERHCTEGITEINGAPPDFDCVCRYCATGKHA